MKQLLVVTTIRSRMDGRLPRRRPCICSGPICRHNCLHPAVYGRSSFRVRLSIMGRETSAEPVHYRVLDQCDSERSSAAFKRPP